MRRVLPQNIPSFAFLALLTLLFLGPPKTIQAQCSSNAFYDACAANLENFSFAKSFEINTGSSVEKEAKLTEYQYVFSKGTYYLITICSPDEANPMVLNLYDRDHKLISSSYDKKKRKYFSTLEYQCNATGVYYLEYTFKSKPNCGISYLGFKR